MKINQLWCVGFRKDKQQLKLSFRIYDAFLDGKTYTIDFNIPVEKGDYTVACHPDVLVLNKIKKIKFEMIGETEDSHIVKRLDSDIDFINDITPIIKQYLLNNQIYINFELSKEIYKTLTIS